MTAAVATRAAPRRTVSPTLHTARRFTVALLQLARWFWAVVVVLVVAGNVVGWVTAGATDVSIASYARQASTWFPFSLAIMLVVAYLRVHVAAGMTRRSFVRAALVVEVGAGLAYAAALTALVLLERAAHDALGWDSVVTEVQVTDASSPAWALYLDLAVPFVVANLSGLLVGAVYQRAGGRWGTLALPLAVAPPAVVLYLAGARLTDLPGIWTTASDTQYLLLLTGVGAGLALVTALAFALVARGTPVTPKP